MDRKIDMSVAVFEALGRGRANMMYMKYLKEAKTDSYLSLDFRLFPVLSLVGSDAFTAQYYIFTRHYLWVLKKPKAAPVRHVKDKNSCNLRRARNF